MTTEEHAFMRELRTLLREWDVTVKFDEEDDPEEPIWVFEDAIGDIYLPIHVIEEELTP